MKIRILKTIEEAGKAEGLVVMIDVFRAFSLECYLFAAGARRIYPVKDLEEARAAAAAHEDCILIGEEGDARAEGCMYGDSPWQTGTGEVAGKRYDGKPDIFTEDNTLDGLAVGPEGPFFPRKHKGFDGTPGCAVVPGLFEELRRPEQTRSLPQVSSMRKLLRSIFLPEIRDLFHWSLRERAGWKMPKKTPSVRNISNHF